LMAWIEAEPVRLLCPDFADIAVVERPFTGSSQ
jgi:hypothetical protein